jgi:hypothetical protein
MSVKLQNNGIVWSYGGSSIYDDGNLNIHTDDRLNVNVRNTYVNGGLVMLGANAISLFEATNVVGVAINCGNESGNPFLYCSQPGVFAGGTFAGRALSSYGLGPGYRTLNRDNAGAGDTLYGDGNFPSGESVRYGLVVTNRIACGTEIGVFSDIRIKNNITELDSLHSLELLRKLQPKTFRYIDIVKNSNNFSYGFIAQEVNKVFSDAVSMKRDTIPNVYSVAEVTTNIFLFRDYTITDLSQNDTIQITDKDSKEQKVTIKEILDEHRFTINEEVEDGNYFVYGKYVNDFHVLEKHSIFTLTTSAVKQLDKELQETKQIVASQQREIDELKSQIAELRNLIMNK